MNAIFIVVQTSQPEEGTQQQQKDGWMSSLLFCRHRSPPKGTELLWLQTVVCKLLHF